VKLGQFRHGGGRPRGIEFRPFGVASALIWDRLVMKVSCIVGTAAVVAGQLMIDSAVMVALAGMHTPPALMFVQGDEPPVAFQDRLRRLDQHRSVLENALRTPRQSAPARAVEALPSEPIHPTAPQEPPAEQQQAAQAQAPVNCEGAAEIAEDYGFSSVRPTACAGQLYTFSALRDGTAYSITITAAGEIADVSRQ
jgi:hypothetical protein